MILELMHIQLAIRPTQAWGGLAWRAEDVPVEPCNRS